MPDKEPFRPTFLETIFGDRLLTKIKELDKITKELTGKLDKTETKIDEQKEVIKLFKEVDLPALQKHIAKADTLTRYYKGLWKGALHIPNIKNYVKDHTLYNPWGPGTGYTVPYTKIVDHKYYTYSMQTWTTILERIHREIKEEMPTWIAEISDCDNYADVMAAAVQLAFIDTGKHRQAAFGKALGRDGPNHHAYNFFVLPNRKIMIYEPQNGAIIGELGQTEGLYQTYDLTI